MEKEIKWIVYQHTSIPYEGCNGVEFFGLYDTKEEAAANFIAQHATAIDDGGVRLNLNRFEEIEIVPVPYYQKEDV